MNIFTEANKISLDDIKLGEELYKRQELAITVRYKLKELGYTLQDELVKNIENDINNYDKYTKEMGEFMISFLSSRVIEIFKQYNCHKTFCFPSIVLLKDNKIGIKYGAGWSHIYMLFDISNNTLHKDSFFISLHKTEDISEHINEIEKELSKIIK